jgi:MFS family permease
VADILTFGRSMNFMITYGSILFVLTTSTISEDLYHFNIAQNGLLIGVTLTIGCLIGESCTGWISDVPVNRYTRRHGGYRKPEARLQLAFLALFLPAGLIITGVCAQKRTPWIGIAAGMVVASIGVQAGTTLTYAYCTDCYKPQAAEVSTMINLSRQVYAFTIYALPFANGVLAPINFLLWLPIIFLMWKGEETRKRQGVPDWHKDL